MKAKLVIEQHPWVNSITQPLLEKKIILGSFPSRKLCEIHQEKPISQLVSSEEMLFFFGSRRNLFWDWYRAFVDSTISNRNPELIRQSLKRYKIGITDVILSCSRKNESSLDKYLYNRIYNHQFFSIPAKGENIKFLCTSKGLMNEMLLNKQFFHLYPFFQDDRIDSLNLQAEIIKLAGGDVKPIRHPISRILRSDSYGTIQCVAIPSPGSPYRKLSEFGANGQTDCYLEQYLKTVFHWFLK